MRPGNAGWREGVDRQVYRGGETMQGTEPKEALSTELNRLSEIAARKVTVGFMLLTCEPV